MFVSTDEKLGVEALELELLGRLLEPALVPPEAALPPAEELPDDPLDMPDEPLELLPDAAGEDEDLSLPELLEELCPTATPDSANSAAAVATLTNFRFNIGWISLGEVGEKTAPSLMQETCPPPDQPAYAAFAVAERCHNACRQR